jgi:hypothetical protein
VTTNPLLVLIDEQDSARAPGKGVFTRVRVDMGFISFTGELPLGTNVVVYDPTVKGSDALAEKELATRLTTANIDPTLAVTRPTKVIVFHCFANDVIGSTWKGDLNKVVATWTTAWQVIQKDDAGKTVLVEGKPVIDDGPVKAALKDLTKSGAFKGFGQEYWGHMKIILDPSGRKDKGTTDTATVWYLDEIFPSKDAMRKAHDALGGTELAEMQPEGVPSGYSAELWQQTLPDVLAAIGTTWTPPHLLKVGKDFGLDVPFLLTLKPVS